MGPVAALVLESLESRVAAPANPEVLPVAPDKRVTRAVNPVAAHKHLVAAVRREQALRQDRTPQLECRAQARRRWEFPCRQPVALPAAVQVSKADRQDQMPPPQAAVRAAVRPTMRAFSRVRAARAVADSKVSQAELQVRKADPQAPTGVVVPAVQAPPATKPVVVQEQMPVPAQVKAMAILAEAVSRTRGELSRDRRAKPAAVP